MPEQNTTDVQQTTSTPIITTPPNNPPAIEPEPPKQQDSRELMQIYDNILADKERENKEMRERLSRMEAERNAPPPNPEADRNAIFERPREIIRDEVNKAIAPLLEVVSGFRSSSVAEQYLNKYANDPRFANYWPQIERHVRGALGQVKGEINDQVVMSLVLGAIGAYQAGLLPGATPPQNNNTLPNNPPAPPNNNRAAQLDMNTPPHLRPSAPPIAEPEVNKPPKRRALTENEKRLARIKGMSDDRYLDYLEMPANRVVGPHKAEVSQ